MESNKLFEDYARTEKKLKAITDRAIRKNQTETALEALNALVIMKYNYNQAYRDDFVEDRLEKLSTAVGEANAADLSFGTKEDTVIFYDSFGADTRGLACIYLKALAGMNYKIVYITNTGAKGKQPVISEVLKSCNATVAYIERGGGFLSVAGQLIRLFAQYQPKYAFEYNQPWDIGGIEAFYLFKNVTRFKINLTDHAFWPGVRSFDYCIEFRDFGCSLSRDYRGLREDQLLLLPYYPYLDRSAKFQGLPFDEGKRFIFTGGYLYKTLGEGNIYYKMIAHMLTTDPELMFLYAGKGDDSQLKILAGQFEGRVFHIAERPDFYQIIERCLFYVNSFPIVGGLMTQYAATAGKIPLTINHGGRAEGLLLESDDAFTLFTNETDLLAEADRLLTDDAYLKAQSEHMKGLVISEERFAAELQRILEQQKTGFAIHWKEIDTTAQHEEYRYAFERKYIDNAIANAENSKLIRYFPLFFIKKMTNRILKKKK